MLNLLIKKLSLLAHSAQTQLFEVVGYFGYYLVLVVLLVLTILVILWFNEIVYKLLLLGVLSLLVVFGWALFSNEFLYVYIGYVVAFTGAVLMLFLSIILMLPVGSSKRNTLKKLKFFSLLVALFGDTKSQSKGGTNNQPTDPSILTIRGFIWHILWCVAIPYLCIKVFFVSIYSAFYIFFFAVPREYLLVWFPLVPSKPVMYKQFICGVWRYTKEQAAGTMKRGVLGHHTWFTNPGEFILDMGLGNDKLLFRRGSYNIFFTALQACAYFIKWFFTIACNKFIYDIEWRSLKAGIFINKVVTSDRVSLQFALEALLLIFWGLFLIGSFASIIPTFLHTHATLPSNHLEPVSTGGLGELQKIIYDQEPVLLIVTGLVLLVALVGAVIFFKRKK